MKNKLIKKRNELLQKFADFICVMLEINIENDEHFDFWMWQGLNLNDWCIEKNIFLN